jgi:hypothetical protein
MVKHRVGATVALVALFQRHTRHQFLFVPRWLPVVLVGRDDLHPQVQMSRRRSL